MKAGVRRFVAATDFSGHANWAAQRAALLAAQHGAQLELLHVVAEGPLDALRKLLHAKPKGVVNLVEGVRHALHDAAAALAKATGASVAPRVEIGEVLDVITQQCSSADLLVVGARGTSPLRDAILGTTAERLLGKCSRPMLVVKRRPAGRYERVLVALDFSRASANAMRATLRLAPQAMFFAVHAYDVPFEGKLRLAGVDRDVIDGYRYRAAKKALADIRALSERAARGRKPVVPKVGQDYPPHLILAQEKTRRVDLVALGKKKRHLVREFLVGSVARHVLADSRSDVLIGPA
jgi:nucleotide-binding universal stress UspA family protein